MSNPMAVHNMKSKLQGKDFLRVGDFTKEDLMDLIYLAINLKNKQKMGEPHRYLEGKTLAMIFEKSSTRTRVSFETRSEEHTSELQSRGHLVCRLLLEKK